MNDGGCTGVLARDNVRSESTAVILKYAIEPLDALDSGAAHEESDLIVFISDR